MLESLTYLGFSRNHVRYQKYVSDPRLLDQVFLPTSAIQQLDNVKPTWTSDHAGHHTNFKFRHGLNKQSRQISWALKLMSELVNGTASSPQMPTVP